MFNETIPLVLSNVAPFISNAIATALFLGPEYSVGINMILMESIKYLSHYLTDFIAIMMIIIITISIIIIKIGFNPIRNVSLFKKYDSVSVMAFEDCTDTGIKFTCSKTFAALNMALIKKYNITKVRYIGYNDIDVVIDICEKYKLENDLYVSVCHDKTNNKKLCMTLLSQKRDLRQIIKDAVNICYSDDKKYKLTMVGHEADGISFNYPEPMMYLTYVLIKFYGMTKLIILTQNRGHDAIENDNNGNSKKISKGVDMKSSDQKKTESIDKIKKNLKNIFLI